MKFHLLHVIPDENVRRAHGLNGYKEVIDTVAWGLTQLGHTVTYAVNEASATATNIVCGAQVMPIEKQRQLPRDSIVYNLEQVRNRNPAEIRAEARYYCENFRLWDYSAFNLDAWAALGTKYPIRTVPIGYAPILERIQRPAEQDLDVLLYGSANEQRLAAFKAMCDSGLSAIFAHNMYGARRDELIGRAKTIANVTFYAQNKVFEVVRVSYLLANRKAVVAHIDPDTAIEPDMLEAVEVSARETLIPNIVALARDPDKRREREERGHDIMVKRDIRRYLAEALA